MAKKKEVKENRLNFDNLTENMRVKLQFANKKDIEVTNETVHNEILSTTDGFRNVADTATLYRGGILQTIHYADGTYAAWPSNWLSMSVKELADYIISKQKYPIV